MPQIGVHAIITNSQGSVLLVQKNYRDRDWAPPGGLMEDGESLPQAVIREVMEETGYLIEPEELVAIGSRPRTNDVIIVFAARIIENPPASDECAIKSVEPSISDEIRQMGFYSLEQLPQPMKAEVRQLLTSFRAGERGKFFVI